MRTRDEANQRPVNDQGAGGGPAESGRSEMSEPGTDKAGQQKSPASSVIATITGLIAAVGTLQGIINGTSVLRTLGTVLVIGATVIAFTVSRDKAVRQARGRLLSLAICMAVAGAAAIAAPLFHHGPRPARHLAVSPSAAGGGRVQPGTSPTRATRPAEQRVTTSPPAIVPAPAPAPIPSNTQVAAPGVPASSDVPRTSAPATFPAGVGHASPPAQHVPAQEPPPTLSAGEVRNQGRLTLQPGQAADLDSLVQGNWNAGYGPWTAANGYNIGYDGSSLAFKGGTGSWAAMGTAGNWNYNSCRYGTPYGNGGQASGSIIAPGHGICYLTSAGNQALLVVRSQSSSAITLSVTIWQD
jgi:hypothetical protein